MNWTGLFDAIDARNLFIIAGLALMTLVTRSLFLFRDRPLKLPLLVERGLPYAPIAALAAVVAPEVALAQGELLDTWRDARLLGTAAGMAWFFWRRSIFGTILCGTAVYLPLRLGLGW